MSAIEVKGFAATFAADDAGAIAGMAWPFGSADREGDIITKGAFAFPAKLPLLLYHDPTKPVGVWESLSQDGDGLEVKGRLLVDDVALAREARALVQAGAVTGLSIGFTPKAATGRKGYGRTITALDLQEISLVTVPCHPGAAVRSVKNGERAVALARVLHRFNQQLLAA